MPSRMRLLQEEGVLHEVAVALHMQLCVCIG